MSFYQELQNQTAAERQRLLSSQTIARCQAGDISQDMYISFLTQAYYHVSHTVPLLMCAGSRLPASHEAVRGAIAEYIDEEYGHQEWILNDIRACGGNAEAVINGVPGLPIEIPYRAGQSNEYIWHGARSGRNQRIHRLSRCSAA